MGPTIHPHVYRPYVGCVLFVTDRDKHEEREGGIEHTSDRTTEL